MGSGRGKTKRSRAKRVKPEVMSSATVATNLLPESSGSVTAETVKILEKGGFSPEVVEMAREFAIADGAKVLTRAQSELLDEFVDHLFAAVKEFGRRANELAVAEGDPVMSDKEREQWESERGFDRDDSEERNRQEMRQSLEYIVEGLNDAEVDEKRASLREYWAENPIDKI